MGYPMSLKNGCGAFANSALNSSCLFTVFRDQLFIFSFTKWNCTIYNPENASYTPFTPLDKKHTNIWLLLSVGKGMMACQSPGQMTLQQTQPIIDCSSNWCDGHKTPEWQWERSQSPIVCMYKKLHIHANLDIKKVIVGDIFSILTTHIDQVVQPTACRFAAVLVDCAGKFVSQQSCKADAMH